MGNAADGKVIEMSPSGNGDNGRDAQGRFTPGNSGGPGNPYARRTAELRAAMLDALTPDAVRRVVLRMIDSALDGDVAAAKIVLERAVGRVLEPDLIERIEALEDALAREEV